MDKHTHGELNQHAQQTLENILAFIKSEGLKRKRLAKKLEMSESNFSEYLNGKRSGILDFASRLAEVLGHDRTFFIREDFDAHRSSEETAKIAFSAGDLSVDGKEGLDQLVRVCDLIETYDIGDDHNA
ncbi:helix-turn-helix transcriptional regulator [Aquibacillus sediminis]|uniref:helix-turn-helix transcriptional regulator n=1 Tax=Aquibacillus sediminis TaxID=2574734 RepID=UPI0011087551|nr:helix-turn-helix transcriptional regulator [Aquibacillus sediminis]